jgi:predicted secreted acid phosphatase
VLNTSAYLAWNVAAGTSFTPDSWSNYVKAKADVPIPGSLEFTQYAASKGVKVFMFPTAPRIRRSRPSRRKTACFCRC